MNVEMGEIRSVDSRSMHFLLDIQSALGNAEEGLLRLDAEAISHRVHELAAHVEVYADLKTDDEKRFALFSAAVLRAADPLTGGSPNIHKTLTEEGYLLEEKIIPTVLHLTATWLCAKFIDVSTPMNADTGPSKTHKQPQKADLQPETEPPKPLEEVPSPIVVPNAAPQPNASSDNTRKSRSSRTGGTTAGTRKKKETAVADEEPPAEPDEGEVVVTPDLIEDETYATYVTEDPETAQRKIKNISSFSDKDLNLLGIYVKQIRRTALLNAEQEVILAKSIEAGLFAQEKLDIAKADGIEIPAKERRMLEIIVRQGQRDKNHLITANLRLVTGVATRYVGDGYALLDAIQDGNMGLMRAVEKFDYAKGFKFSTYAMWWIRQAITRGRADTGRTIRIPVHINDQLNQIRAAKRALQHQLGRSPTVLELAEDTGYDADQVLELQKLDRTLLSLDFAVNETEEGAPAFGDFLRDTIEETPESVLARSEFWDLVEKRSVDMGYVTKHELNVFLLINREHKTATEVAKILDVPVGKVRRRNAVACAKLLHPSFKLDLSYM